MSAFALIRGSARRPRWLSAVSALGVLTALVLAVACWGEASAQTAVSRPASRTQTDTTTITTPYATNGRTRTWAYTWSATGQLLSVDGPLAGAGDKVTYTYSALDYLQKVTDQRGHTTTITAWNGRGRPTSIVDANAVKTNLSYDIHDWVLTVTVNPGASQSLYVFTYDAVGNLTKLTRPEGGYLTYTYDTGNRLTGIANDRGQTQTFTVNALGDPTQVTVKTAGATITAQQSYVYDELGRTIQAIGAGSQTTGFAYDKVDNPKSVTDARGKLFQSSFDALNRVITETNPQSQTVQRDYSPSDVLTSHKDGRVLETTRVVDGFGQVIREVSPDRGTLTYWYDAAGNLTKLVDGDGQETDYVYDTASRLTSATFVGASAETITYTYDSIVSGNKGVGRLTGVTEQSGSSAFVYDAQGRLTRDTKVIQGHSYAVQYGYDRNGLLTGVTLPSGRLVTITRAIDGLVSGVTTKATPTSAVDTIASGVSYRPFGPLESLTYGNGLTLTRTFDQNYWLGRVEVKATAVTRLDLSFARNENGQLAGVTDNASSGRGATFTYTDAGRLASAQGAWGGDSYTYDAAGGRLDKARQIGATTTHETAVDASTSNRVDSVQDGASATLRTLTWRTGGDLAQSVYAGGPTYDYQYNARKRLSLVNLNSVTRAQYGYDFRGQRVWADVSASMAHHSHFIFDSNGHLLAEHDAATGNPVREYLWVDDLLVAVIDSSTGTASTYFVHPGQLDEPLIMTDASRAMVWNAYVEPYGLATMLSMPSVGLPLRLPGQWEEIEDGDLSQNWRRNYDPSLGRYIEADPLGIEAGQSVYAYVDGDPLNNSDPWGLGPAGSLLGAEIGAWTAGVVGIETGPGEAGVIPAGALLGRSIGNALEDSISIAENNKQTRRKIAGLERQIEDHKRKLQKDPNCREANHWRGEIRAWTMRIKRLRGRLPNGT